MPKKTKSIKVTDRKKAWLKKAKPYRYKIETRETNKLILIVSEGQTEKMYFESFPVLGLTVEIINLGGQSKLKLIQLTEQIKQNSNKNYDEIWCVFDMDIHQGAKEFADFDNAIESGKAKGFKIAYSNDAFELWFYLHYNTTSQQNHRQFYYKELSKYWNCNYEKAGKKQFFCSTIYENLQNDKDSSQGKAVERADKLFQKQKHLPYHKQNPVTTVYKLVKFLNQNLRG